MGRVIARVGTEIQKLANQERAEDLTNKIFGFKDYLIDKYQKNYLDNEEVQNKLLTFEVNGEFLKNCCDQTKTGVLEIKSDEQILKILNTNISIFLAVEALSSSAISVEDSQKYNSLIESAKRLIESVNNFMDKVWNNCPDIGARKVAVVIYPTLINLLNKFSEQANNVLPYAKNVFGLFASADKSNKHSVIVPSPQGDQIPHANLAIEWQNNY